MNVTIKHVLAASLLGSTAMVPAAVAQTQSEQDCQDLEVILQENNERIEQGWLDEATVVLERGDAQECGAYADAAERALEQADASGTMQEGQDQTATQGQAQVDDQGRVVVLMPEPTVTVQQDAPEVTVTEAEPQVSVQQGQPEIIVRQAQPTVTIQMPQPTVTIDQPAPEIIVRMPEPDIQVSQADPEVEVTQSDPNVQVQQGEPEVAVEQGEADVQVEQDEAVVQLQEEASEANVDLQQAQQAPRITYESAEPNVQVESSGEPQVEFTQSGEPNIRMESAGEGEQETAQAGQDPAAAAEGEQETAQAEQDPAAAAEGEQEPAMLADADFRTERELLTAPVIEREDFTVVEAGTVSLDELEGVNVYGVNDEVIAEIGDVIIGEGGQVQYFVMDVGGFLGLGEREVAVGFDEATILTDESGNDYRVYIDASEEQLENLPEYEAG